MATKKASTPDPEGASSVVTITDEDGRVHYTARNSPTYDKLIAAGGTAEDVPDEQEAAGDAPSDAS